MQEETTQKTVALAIRISRLTEEVLRRAIRMYLQSQRHPPSKKERHGKMTVRQILKKESGVKVLEVGDEKIRSLKRAARKYRIDYAIKKDKTLNPPKYVVFFKGKDLDVINRGFMEFCRLDEKKPRRSIRQFLGKAKKQDREHKEREKIRQKEQENER